MGSRHLSDTSPQKLHIDRRVTKATWQGHRRQVQPLKSAIIQSFKEFESLRLRFSEEGLTGW